ncbi:hypothetical protein BsWGS_02396 [Bradybaena similaris]
MEELCGKFILDSIEDTASGDTEFEQEPDILEDEVKWAIKNLTKNKSPGVDEIPNELIKEAGEEIIKPIRILCIEIWKREVTLSHKLYASKEELQTMVDIILGTKVVVSS